MFPQSTILGPLFWIVIGLLYAFTFYSARIWFRDIGIKMTMVKWLLIAVFFILVNLSIGGGFTLIGEDEKNAGIYFTSIGLVICTILGVGLWRYLLSGKKE